MPANNQPAPAPKRKVNSFIVIGITAIALAIFIGLASVATRSLGQLADKVAKLELCSSSKQVALQVDESLPGEFSTVYSYSTCTGQPTKLVTTDRLTMMVASDGEFESASVVKNAVGTSLKQAGWSVEGDEYTYSKAPAYVATVEAHSYQPALAIITLENTEPNSDVGLVGEPLKTNPADEQAIAKYLKFTAYKPTYMPPIGEPEWHKHQTEDRLSEWSYSLHTPGQASTTISLQSHPADSEQIDHINDNDYREAFKLSDGSSVIGRYYSSSGQFSSQAVFLKKATTYIELTGVDINQNLADQKYRYLTRNEAIKVLESLEPINQPAK